MIWEIPTEIAQRGTNSVSGPDKLMTKRLLKILLGLIILTLFYTSPGFTQSSEELESLRKEIEALKRGQITIQKELQAIKNLLQRMQTPVPQTRLILSTEGSPFKGDKNSKLTLIEFSDYQCPFCGRHFRQTMPLIDRDYVKTGKLKYVFRDFPIEAIHPLAFKAHEAAHCAGEQRKYWEMHDRLFANQKALNPKDLSRHAKALGLDLSNFRQCLGSGKYAKKIRKDMAEGVKAGVKGTPTFFLGFTNPNDSKLRPMIRIRGAHPYPKFKQAIENLLSSR